MEEEKKKNFNSSKCEGQRQNEINDATLRVISDAFRETEIKRDWENAQREREREAESLG